VVWVVAVGAGLHPRLVLVSAGELIGRDWLLVVVGGGWGFRPGGGAGMLDRVGFGFCGVECCGPRLGVARGGGLPAD